MCHTEPMATVDDDIDVDDTPPAPTRSVPAPDEVKELGRREANKRATRRALGEAAIRLFLEQGFATTTIDEIADLASVSRRTFFHYFPTKEAAAFPDHDTQVADVREGLEASDESGSAAVAAAVITAGVAEMVDSKAYVRQRYALLMEIPEIRDQDMRDDLDYEDVLAEYLSSGPMSGFEARSTAAQIVGTMRAALTEWATDSDFDPVAALNNSWDRLGYLGR